MDRRPQVSRSYPFSAEGRIGHETEGLVETSADTNQIPANGIDVFRTCSK
ncbi:hypothetical protein MKSMC1_29850 [Mycobacterium kansasii]|nr:hypothetical protein MKSMC1_29850 [Mycobacterium kansasii]